MYVLVEHKSSPYSWTLLQLLKYILKSHLEETLKELGTLPIDEQMRAFLSSFFKYILSAGRGVRSEDLSRIIDSAGFKESGEVYMTIAEELKLEGKREENEKERSLTISKS